MNVKKLDGKDVTRKQDVGVIIGRFQVHKLHSEHKKLIQTVIDSHPKVILFLGLSPILGDYNDPLDFRCRKAMIQEDFPNLEIHYIDDVNNPVLEESNRIWSENLDAQIRKWTLPVQTVLLYGGRSSFVDSYRGKYPTCELEPEVFVSGTEIRHQVINSYPPTEGYRAGIITGAAQRFPTAYQAVDVAIFRNEKTQILLVKKPKEDKWRLLGGFSDPESDSLEADVIREAREESTLEIADPKYVGSGLVKLDPRYLKSRDKIKTALFEATYVFGTPQGRDDVRFAKWFDVEFVKKNYKEEVMLTHHFLIEMLIEKGVI